MAGCGEVAVVDGADVAESLRAAQQLEAGGVTATREPSSQGAGWRVTVAADEVARAVAALRTAPEQPTGRPLLESLAEERARLDRALGDQLARSIEGMEGVLWARVHLAEETSPRLDEPVAAPPRRASVAVHLRAAARLDPAHLQRLVADAVRGLAPENVAVLITTAPRSPGAPRLLRVGPFLVAAHSAQPLRVALSLLLATNITLAALGLWGWRRRSAGHAPPAAMG